jgi:predicted amidohydrolase
MRIGLLQFRAGPDKARNLETIRRLAADAAHQGAELAVVPECAMVDTTTAEEAVRESEPLDGPFVTGLAELAARHGLALVAGVLERVPRSTSRVFNTAVAIDGDGTVLGSYRKIHMFDAFGHHESDRHQAGDGDLLLFTRGGVRFGVQICYDVRFPELTRALVAEGAQVVLTPAAWAHGFLKELHWTVLVQARAIENTVYVAAADQSGIDRPGRSMLVDPMGVPIAALAEEEGVVVGDVDPARLERVRAAVPSLTHLRPDLYARWRPAPALT